MNAAHTTTDENTIKAAVTMLRLGIATQAEIASLAGTSRALVGYWARRADVEPLAARKDYLAREWARRMDG